jgi:hypothetical protein
MKGQNHLMTKIFNLLIHISLCLPIFVQKLFWYFYSIMLFKKLFRLTLYQLGQLHYHSMSFQKSSSKVVKVTIIFYRSCHNHRRTDPFFYVVYGILLEKNNNIPKKQKEIIRTSNDFLQ